MVKCEVCKQNITELIMGKVKGTYLKGKGKIYKICSACQKQYSVADLKKKLKIKRVKK
jgi:hypothetical protein